MGFINHGSTSGAPKKSLFGESLKSLSLGFWGLGVKVYGLRSQRKNPDVSAETATVDS